MAQLTRFNPSAASTGFSDFPVVSPVVSRNNKPASHAEFNVLKKLEAELIEHRYYLEQKVGQRTEQLAKRIELLESCNAALCGKLAEAVKQNAELRMQLADVQAGLVPNE